MCLLGADPCPVPVPCLLLSTLLSSKLAPRRDTQRLSARCKGTGGQEPQARPPCAAESIHLCFVIREVETT